MNIGTALVVFAHPDDAEFMCGGMSAAWAREGTEVHYVCVTDGSAGSNDPEMTRERLSEVRASEQRAAAEVLGVKSVTFLGFPDGRLEVTIDLREAVTREVRRLRPDVIVAPDPSRLWAPGRYVNHPDHKAVGEAALCVVMPDASSRLQFPDLIDQGFEPFGVPRLWLAADEEAADGFVDITGTIDLKLQALACHASQNDGQSEVEGWVRARAARFGELAGAEYAEGFRTFAFLEE